MTRSTITDTSQSPYSRLKPIPLDSIRLIGGFWAHKIRMNRDVTIPAQYDRLEEIGAIDNFRRASGRIHREFSGRAAHDADVYKWVEAASISLASEDSEDLRKLVDKVITEIVEAQEDDGYLDTYFTFEKRSDRWRNLRDMHELYCAGHLIQAGIANFRATGERKLINAASAVADHVNKVFRANGRPGTCGHPNIEMALTELYREIGNREYLNLACFFLDNRGHGYAGGDIVHIDHKPFRELDEMVGHAVRILYLNCGAADIYMETGDRTLLDVLERLWGNMTEKKMYITGGLGARYQGESFGRDYELPNEGAYAETCAAIANVMWNWRMLLMTGQGRFADVMELALYNGMLSGISLGGTEYFYVNPLASDGSHRRQRWFQCACCPPNIARTIASIPGYLYTTSEEGIWLHHYASNTAEIDFRGTKVRLVQETDYPWCGDVNVELVSPGSFDLFMRVPSWCNEPSLSLNGMPVEAQFKDGYFQIKRDWNSGDKVCLSLPMEPRLMMCNTHVFDNFGRVAIRRGPMIYCVEQDDNPWGDVRTLKISNKTHLSISKQMLFDGIVVIEGDGIGLDQDGCDNRLYFPVNEWSAREKVVRFRAIPYYTWANREPGPMEVWVSSCF